MTDKELKKLSRLELLEVLLEESKENEKLRKSLKNAKAEIAVSESIKKASEITEQAREVLEYANSLSVNLKEAVKRASYTELKFNSSAAYIGNVPPTKKIIAKGPFKYETDKTPSSSVSDRDLYWRLMGFFAKNDGVLNYLPSDISEDVRVRVKEILDDIKKRDKRYSQENSLNGKK